MFVRNAPKIAKLVTPEWTIDSYVTPLGHDISFNISFVVVVVVFFVCTCVFFKYTTFSGTKIC